MAAWGTEPWDNDMAADWFTKLWAGTPVVERVNAGLQSDRGEEVVAALWVASVLCRMYVWPMGELDETMDLALAGADRLLARQDPDRYLDDAENDLVKTKIDVFRAQLAVRKG